MATNNVHFMSFHFKPFCLLIAIIVVVTFYFAEVHAENGIEITLDFEWGAGGKTNWNGGLTVSKGKVLEVSNTLLEPSEHFSLVSEKKIVWQSETNGPTDGIRVKFHLPLGAIIYFQTPYGTNEFLINDILSCPQKQRVGEHGQYISIKRYNRDYIYFLNERPNYIFSPGEQWTFKWKLDLKKQVNIKHASYEVSVINDKSGSLIYKSPKKMFMINNSTQFLAEETVQLPYEEGVYSIYVRIKRIDEISPPDLRAQLVVISPIESKITLCGEQNNLQIIDQIMTASNYNSDRFRDDGTSRVIKNQDVSYRVSGSKAVPCSSIINRKCNLNWYGYQLKIKNVGKPHLLKVTYPKDKTRRFVISIIEESPNPKGKTDYQIDQGIVVENPDTENALNMGVKDIIFWPTTEKPTVAIVNTLNGSEAAVERIDLLEFTIGLVPKPLPKDKEIGPYFEEPFFVKSLGGKTISDPGLKVGSRTITDWSTFYDATLHLVELMRYRGYNAAMIPVLAYGGTLYPSKLVKNNGRYDNEIIAEDSMHIQQKDVVLLLLKIFERNNITLFPSFVFYYPIDEIEKQRDNIDIEDSIYSIYRSGQTAQSKLKFDNNGMLGPRYNPLNFAVQEEVKAIVKEFVERYKNNSALGNIALQLNTSGWIQYPGLNWGYDPKSIKNFFVDSGLQIPSFINLKGISKSLDNRSNTIKGQAGSLSIPNIHNIYFSQAYDYLNSDEVKPVWIKWRNEKLKQFYSSIADIIHKNGNERKLLLAYMNIFSSRYSDDPPKKALALKMSPIDLLSFKGVNPLLYKTNELIEVLAPVRTATPLYKQRIEQASISRNPETIDLFKKAKAKGFLEFHDYFETKIKTLDEKWWFPTNYWMVATFDVAENLGPETFYPDGKYFFSGGWQPMQ